MPKQKFDIIKLKKVKQKLVTDLTIWDQFLQKGYFQSNQKKEISSSNLAYFNKFLCQISP